MRIRVKYGVSVQENQKLEIAGVVDGAKLTHVTLKKFYVENGYHSGRFVVYSKTVWEEVPEIKLERVNFIITEDSALRIMRPDGSWSITADLPLGYRWDLQDGNLMIQRIVSP